jgi:hypothetical protein
MTAFPTTRRVLLIAGLAASVAGASPAMATHHRRPEVPAVPSNLEVPEGHRLFFVAHATGTQNYICLVAGQAWTLIGPQATLVNRFDQQILTHYLSLNPEEPGTARATWHHSGDSSSVWGQAIETSTDSAYVAPGAIAWLKLKVVGHEEGPTGGNRLAEATYIQRVNTEGGVAPAGVCPSVGARAFVPYETDYVFYRER